MLLSCGPNLARRANRGEVAVLVKDLDISVHQISESAQRLLDRAADEARKRGHTALWDAKGLSLMPRMLRRFAAPSKRFSRE